MYFPYPYPDELLFSLIARYHIHSANSNRIQTSRDLLQPVNTPVWNGFPKKWGKFIESIPENLGLKMDMLIHNHTIFPLYKAFFPYETSMYIDEITSANIINSRLPFVEFELYPKFWRYCEQCVKEDIKIHGELYLKRIHQITGLPICLIHEEELMNSNVSVINNDSYIIKLRKAHFRSNKRLEGLFSIAKDIEWIFNHMPEPKELNWSEIYQEYLVGSTSFIDAKGNIELILLSEKITEFYGEACMELIMSEIFGHIYGAREWLQELIYQPEMKVHPVLHLLLIHFLGLTYEELLNQSGLSVDLHFCKKNIESEKQLVVSV